MRPVSPFERRTAVRVVGNDRPTARPVPTDYRAATRTLDVVELAHDVARVVSLGRFLRTHPELLLPPPGTGYPTAEVGGPTRRPDRPGQRAGARAASASPARLGLKAGLNLANLTGSDAGKDNGFSSLVGLNAGLMADFAFNEHVAFHPELLYSQKGAKLSDSFSYTDDAVRVEQRTTGQIRLHYLDLPLLLRGKANGFFVEAGPQLGYLMGQKTDLTLTSTATAVGGAPVTSTETETNTATDGIRRFEVGYAVGVGYQLPRGLELGVRYNGGFTSLDNDNNPDLRAKVRNSVFQFQVGYLFGGK